MTDRIETCHARKIVKVSESLRGSTRVTQGGGSALRQQRPSVGAGRKRAATATAGPRPLLFPKGNFLICLVSRSLEQMYMEQGTASAE